MIPLYDMHCHIIPGVDDGSVDMEQTINMLKIAYEDGIRGIIATPHYHIGRVVADISQCQWKLGDMLKNIEDMNMDMELYLGNEIYYFSDAMGKLVNDEIRTMADSSYILLEFDPKTEYGRILHAVNDTAINGYIPIIAHVERYECMVEKPDRCVEIMDRGALLQVNASSVMGSHGKEIQKFIKKLMKKRYVSFVASDAHSDRHRAPRLSECYMYVKKKFGEDYANEIFCYNQIRIIEDR